MLEQTFVGKSRDAASARDDRSLRRFWTVVLETEAASLDEWEKQMSSSTSSAARSPMDGHTELVTGGYRVIFRVE